MPNDTLGSPGSASSPSNQFQQFFNPHMNADVSPGTKSELVFTHICLFSFLNFPAEHNNLILSFLCAEQQQDAALDSVIGELDTSYIDIPDLIPHTEEGNATRDDALKEKE